MKKLSGTIWISLLLFVVTPAGAFAQYGRRDNRTGDRVCVYRDSNFQGWEECYRPGDQVADLRAHGNNISSIRVYGNAVLLVYDGRNFTGRSAEITSEVQDLSRTGAFRGQGRGQARGQVWNDRIESFRVASSNYRTSVPPVYGRDNQNGDYRGTGSVCVYEDYDYRGRVECFDSGRELPDLERSGRWSDRISSIRIIGNGRAVAFVDIGYNGERLVLDRDIPDLSHLSMSNGKTWDNQISSIEVGAGRNAGRIR